MSWAKFRGKGVSGLKIGSSITLPVKSAKDEHPALKCKRYFSSKAYAILFKCISDHPYNEEWCKNTEHNWNSSLPMHIRRKYKFLAIDDSFLSP